MKNLSKILALILTVAMVLSFAGCFHEKGEIAVTVDGMEFTSAYYMCALMAADSEAKGIVYDSLSEEEQQKTDIDYYSYKVEKKDYVKWVEEKAIEIIKELAAVKKLCKEKGVTLDKDTEKNLEDSINSSWTQELTYYTINGEGGKTYADYYAANGIGKETYIQFSKDNALRTAYFDSIYGKEGTSAVTEEEIKANLYKNYNIANILFGAFGSDYSDAEKAELKAKFEGYEKELKNGKKTFEQVYKDYNKITDSEETTETKTEEEDATPTPKDKYASLLGAKDTDYASEYFDIVGAMKVGEVKMMEITGKAGYVILIKGDIEGDSYYVENMDSTIRHALKDEDFDKAIAKAADDLKADVDDSAIAPFDVKGIVEPEYSYS